MTKHFSVLEVHLPSKLFSPEEYRIPDAIVWPHVVIWHAALIEPQWIHLTRPRRLAREVGCTEYMHFPWQGIIHEIERQDSSLLDSDRLASPSLFFKLPRKKLERAYRIFLKSLFSICSNMSSVVEINLPLLSRLRVWSLLAQPGRACNRTNIKSPSNLLRLAFRV